MRKVAIALAFILATAFAGFASRASAQIVTQSLYIEGSNFQLQNGDGSVSPIDPLFLDVDLTFDSSADITGSTAGLTVNSTNIPWGIEYSYQASSGILIFATNPTPASCTLGAGSFCIDFSDGAQPLPQLFSFYQSTSTLGLYSTLSYVWVTRDQPASVPEPASWIMMLVGFGAIAFTMRRYGIARLAFG